MHYENTPIQTNWKFYQQKNENFQINNSDIFHISAQNIDCGYSLEPPRRERNNIYPCKPQFYYIKVGFKGVKVIQACFRDGTLLGAVNNFLEK